MKDNETKTKTIKQVEVNETNRKGNERTIKEISA